MAGYSIPPGYASIYCQTWFGLYQNIEHSIPIDLDCLLPFPPFDEDLVFDWEGRVDGTLETYERISEGVDNGEFVGGEVLTFDETTDQINLGFQTTNRDISFKCRALNTTADNSATFNEGTTSTPYKYVSFQIRRTDEKIYVYTGDGSGFEPISTGVLTHTGENYYGFSISATGLLRIYFNDTKVLEQQLTLNECPLFNAYISNSNYRALLGDISNMEFYDYEIPEAQWTAPPTLPIREVFGNGNTVDSVSGAVMAVTGSLITTLENSGSLPSVNAALNRGFTQRLDGTQPIYNSAGIKTAANVAGDEEHAGGEDIFHNGINSYFSTNVLGNVAAKFDILDRINQTTASTDSIYYDATDRESRSKYYVGLEANELDITVLDSYMEQADKEKAYTQMKVSYCDIQEMSRFFVYATQKTGTDAVQVHDYINNTCQLVTSEGVQDYHLTLPVWIDLTP